MIRVALVLMMLSNIFHGGDTICDSGVIDCRDIIQRIARFGTFDPKVMDRFHEYDTLLPLIMPYMTPSFIKRTLNVKPPLAKKVYVGVQLWLHSKEGMIALEKMNNWKKETLDSQYAGLADEIAEGADAEPWVCKAGRSILPRHKEWILRSTAEWKRLMKSRDDPPFNYKYNVCFRKGSVSGGGCQWWSIGPLCEMMNADNPYDYNDTCITMNGGDEPVVPIDCLVPGHKCGELENGTIGSKFGYPANWLRCPGRGGLQRAGIPVWSQTTLPGCTLDLLFPQVGFASSWKHRTLPWDKLKGEKISFRVAMTGYMKEHNPPSNHRIRLLQYLNEHNADFSRGRSNFSKIPVDFGFVGEPGHVHPEVWAKIKNLSRPYIPWQEYFTQRYHIDVQGNSFSVRFPQLIKVGGLVFSAFIFEDLATMAVEPGKHFVRFDFSYKDLGPKIHYYTHHEDAARRIAQAGAELIGSLNIKYWQCYMFYALREYKKLFD